MSMSNSQWQRICKVADELKAISREMSVDLPHLAQIYAAFAEAVKSHFPAREGDVFMIKVPPRWMAAVNDSEFMFAGRPAEIELFLDNGVADTGRKRKIRTPYTKLADAVSEAQVPGTREEDEHSDE
jgi:hypothetical protein